MLNTLKPDYSSLARNKAMAMWIASLQKPHCANAVVKAVLARRCVALSCGS